MTTDLVVGVITDVHVGPEATFDGKLRKLTAHAEQLLEEFVQEMNSRVKPDVVVHLGDAIEDQDREVDRERYLRALSILNGLHCPVMHVAGNHDLVHLSAEEIARAWGFPDGAPLSHSRMLGGYQLLVLRTHEVKDVGVDVLDADLSWLERELASSSAPGILFMHHSAADQVLIGNRWFERSPQLCLIRRRKRLRELVAASGRVLLVVNGHLHWNQLSVHDGIPYVTLQSLVENLDDDRPGRPARAHGVVRVTPRRVLVEARGEESARYQWERPSR